jgi:shikimate kinase
VTPRTVVLIGLMGSGKTSVGRALAARLDRRFVDNDRAFETRTGLTAAAYARRHGDDAMHTVEAEVLAGLVDDPTAGVIAAPGSVVLMDAAVLDGAFVVFLDVAPEVLAGRVEPDDHRPLLGDDPLGALSRMHAVRGSTYRGLADLTVEAAGRGVADVVDQLVAALPSGDHSDDPDGPSAGRDTGAHR